MNIWLKTALIALMLIPIAGSAEWLIYDNNQPLGERYHENQDDGYGVKFVPDDPPGFIMVMKAYIGRHTDNEWDGFNVKIYDWDGTAEEPKDFKYDCGELIGSGNNDGWFTLDFPDYEWSSTAPFVIALTNIFGSNNVDTIYTDADGRSDNGLYFELVSGVWSLITPPPSGDLMVRVYFSGTPVESTSLGEIKAVFK